jgi:RNA polymerase sigma-70 factor (ECF subfamily)
MAVGKPSDLIFHVRRMVGRGPDDAQTDRHLLRRFAVHREPGAFEALLRRHGPMVLGVCRRVLPDVHDADDAFQATFLVLMAKAGAIRSPELLANWLYGVAYRTALRARANAAKRKVHERQAGIMATAARNPEGVWTDLRPLLDQELSRLPEKYRVPVVLCYLEGKTNEEAGRELGWPKGTVSGRLARARDLLRTRLARRGVALPTGLLAVVLAENALAAPVPAPLFIATVKAALLGAVGPAAAAGAMSAPAAALAEGVLKTMFVTKLNVAAALVLAVGVVATGTGVLTHQALAGKAAGLQEQPARAAADNDKPKPAPKDAGQPNADKDKLQGAWVGVSGEMDGKQAAAEEIQETRIVFRGDKLLIKAGEGREVAYKLDATTKPKLMYWTHEGQTVPVIYQLQGDTLKVCWDAKDGKKQAQDFATEAGSGLMLLVFKRAAAGEAEPAGKERGKKFGSAADRTRSANNLKQIALAMHNYHDVNGHLPAAAVYSKDGTPLLSWRVLLLPYLEQDPLYKEFHLDEPWDSAHNKKLLAQIPKVYAPVAGEAKGTDKTHYRVFTGKGTVFEGDKGLRLTDIPDGTSNTILVVEAGDAVPWTKPADLPYDPDKALPALGGLFEKGFHVALADGSVRFMANGFKEKLMRALITRNGGEVIDRND